MTYEADHSRLARTRGRASQHNCVDCGKQARDWSQIHGTYDYEPRCRSCHMAYDGHKVGANQGSSNGRAILTEEDVANIRKMLSEGHVQAKIAEWYVVARSTISLINCSYNWNNHAAARIS